MWFAIRVLPSLLYLLWFGECSFLSSWVFWGHWAATSVEASKAPGRHPEDTQEAHRRLPESSLHLGANML